MTSPPAFPPHGKRNVWTEDRLLVVHSRGPWNVEFIHEGHALVLKEIGVFARQPWMVLGLIYGEGLQTPDALAAQVESIKAQHLLGRRGTALVLVDKTDSVFFNDFYRRMYAEAEETVVFFPDETSSPARLAEQRPSLDYPAA